MANVLTIEEAEIRYRNFQGRESQFNREGDRNFCVMLEPALADQLAADDWNIKTTKAREDGDEELPYMQVSVNFKGRIPAKIYLVSQRGKTLLDEELCDQLDVIDIKNADLIINPYHWEIGGKTGIKGYLSTAYITIEENPIDLKYADVPDAADWVPPDEEEGY